MSKKFEFELNKPAVREFLRGQEMQSFLGEKASKISARCGEGYKSDVYVGTNRANSMISADTFLAKRDNLKNNTILKALK